MSPIRRHVHSISHPSLKWVHSRFALTHPYSLNRGVSARISPPIILTGQLSKSLRTSMLTCAFTAALRTLRHVSASPDKTAIQLNVSLPSPRCLRRNPSPRVHLPHSGWGPHSFYGTRQQRPNRSHCPHHPHQRIGGPQLTMATVPNSGQRKGNTDHLGRGNRGNRWKHTPATGREPSTILMRVAPGPKLDANWVVRPYRLHSLWMRLFCCKNND